MGPEAATTLLTISPRPVLIDASGHLYELTGEPIDMPAIGLSPAEVLAGIADDEAGRTTPPGEIMARRTD